MFIIFILFTVCNVDKLDPRSNYYPNRSIEILVNELKKIGLDECRLEGRESNDWKLVDASDIIVHIFNPEKRDFYDLEKMWSTEIPKEKAIV